MLYEHYPEPTPMSTSSRNSGYSAVPLAPTLNEEMAGVTERPHRGHEEFQADLDRWMVSYNTGRLHQIRLHRGELLLGVICDFRAEQDSKGFSEKR